MLCIDEFESPIGPIIVAVGDHGVERVIITKTCAHKPFHCDENVEKDSFACRHAIMQLQEYFAGTRTAFTVPLNPQGTSFCKQVWSTLQTISYGQTKSYKDIAIELGNFRASRAVGFACAHNPIPLFIPCHRVVGSRGQLTGYLGDHRDIKQFLLSHEE